MIGPRLVAALPLLFSVACLSQEVKLQGFEDASCGAWAQSAKRPGERQIYVYWIRGFVSGYNYGNPARQVGIAQMPNNATVELYIDKYCRENPLISFYGGVIGLMRELAPIAATAPKDSPAKLGKGGQK